MSISDRLGQIRARIVRAREGRHTDRYMVLDVDTPALVEAVRAVFDLHLFYDQCDEGCCRYCESCEHEWPCPTAVAIEAALGEGHGNA